MSTISHALRVIRLIRQPETALSLTPRDWNDILPRMRKSRLLGRFTVRAERAGVLDRLPLPVRKQLDAAMVLVRSTHHTLVWEALEVERVLARAEVPAILLKGAAFMAAGRRASDGRASNDLDILVPKDALDLVTDCLRDAGWEDSSMDAAEQKHFRDWMHQIPAMYHGIRQTAVDIHHAIAPIAGLVSVESAPLFEASAALPGRYLRVLSPEDMVIMTAVHWARSSGLSGSIRDFLDIDDLVQEFAEADAGFHDRLTMRADALGVRWLMKETLALAHDFFGTPGSYEPPARVLRYLILLASVPSGPAPPNVLQISARQILDWRSYRMQMPFSLMIKRAIKSRFENLQGLLRLRRQPTT